MDTTLEIDRDALAGRRARVAAHCGRPALIAGGAPLPRTYAANTWPFRAHSHFLYLVGAHLPGAYLLLDDDPAVYAPEPHADDALWHGAATTFGDWALWLGLPVRPLHFLEERLGPMTATLAPADPRTCDALAGLLGRPVRPETVAHVDEALADAIIGARLVHDACAVRGLRQAADATAAAHLAGMRATRAGVRAWTVKAAMEAELARRGMGTAYGSIVTPHGEILHDEAHHHLLHDGDLLLADVGAETRGGWAGDVTRTWPVRGRFEGAQKAIYEVVLAAQAAAIDAARPGVRYRDVHLTAARALTEGLVALGILRGDVETLVAEDVYAWFFPHGVGHLIGLDVHDMEDLGDRAGYAPGLARSDRPSLRYLRLDRDLAPGMAVTIEPGFYQVPALLARCTDPRVDRGRLEAFGSVRGVRIEDDVLITAGGNEVLTRAIPKTTAEVEAAVGG